MQVRKGLNSTDHREDAITIAACIGGCARARPPFFVHRGERMAQSDITFAKVWEDGGATCLARVLGNAGTAITQAATTSISCAVYDESSSTPDTAIVTPTVTVSSSVFDTLQTDAIWTLDTTGYNFKHALPATAFPSPNRMYRVEYKVTPTSGAVFWIVYRMHSQMIRT